MTPSLDPAQYLAKTNTTFLVGDISKVLIGCNTLASVHFGPGVSDDGKAKAVMGYFSHSVKELLFNLKNVPRSFANGSVTHQCVEPENYFTTSPSSQYPTIHTNFRSFIHERTEPEKIITNATKMFFPRYENQFAVGEPLFAGLFECTYVRYDWKSGDKIHNQTYHKQLAGNTTNELLKLNDSDSVTNLSIACLEYFAWMSGVHDSSSESFHHLTPLLAQLLAVLMATLVVILV